MINTRLILVEGPPGSGKTTTAGKLAEAVNRAGKDCQCFWEWSPDHPIPIGDDLHLDQVIRTSIARERETHALWQRFVQSRQADQIVTVLESRFWQTSLCLAQALAARLIRETQISQITLIAQMGPKSAQSA